MYITIDESDRRPIYRQVADEIKSLIARGELREGMAFPTGRQAADELGINLNTISAAYRDPRHARRTHCRTRGHRTPCAGSHHPPAARPPSTRRASGPPPATVGTARRVANHQRALVPISPTEAIPQPPASPVMVAVRRRPSIP